MNAHTKPVAIELPRLDLRIMRVRLIGDSPLICHAWSEKAKLMMLNKQMKKAAQKKDAKSPEQDFCDSLYWLTEKPAAGSFQMPDDAKFGFPVIAFKAAATSACRFVEGIKMTEVRGAFHIQGEMAQIDGVPAPREDMVRVGMGTADIRYRGEFKEWSTDLTIRYNAAALAPEQIVNLLNVAGFGVGVGEWRPEKDGSFGMFHVATDGE